MHILDQLKELFSFSKKERNGVFILMILIVSAILYRIALPLFIHNGKTDFREIEKQIARIVPNKNELQDKLEDSINPYEYVEKKAPLSPFLFDPNTISLEKLEKMGISAKLSNTIINYRNKGGKFRTKDDLKKIYTLDEKTFRTLEPFIQIKEVPNSISAKKMKTFIYPTNVAPEIIELNKADSTELIKLNGIGPYYARKIIKYREKLGGYVNTKQLLEIYKMKDSTYMKILDQIRVDSTLVRKLHINTATVEELAVHPYIQRNLAKVIVNYRKQHGPYKNINELGNIHSVSQDIQERLSPYLLLK